MCCVDNILSVAGMWRQVARAALSPGTQPLVTGDRRKQSMVISTYLHLFDISFLVAFIKRLENSFINIGGPKKDRLLFNSGTG